MGEKKDQRQPGATDARPKLDPELRPKHDGPLTHEETMEIARAVMRKNHDVLAALAASGEKPPKVH